MKSQQYRTVISTSNMQSTPSVKHSGMFPASNPLPGVMVYPNSNNMQHVPPISPIPRSMSMSNFNRVPVGQMNIPLEGVGYIGPQTIPANIKLSPPLSPQTPNNIGINNKILSSCMPWINPCNPTIVPPPKISNPLYPDQLTQPDSSAHKQLQTYGVSPATHNLGFFCCGQTETNKSMTPEFPGSQESNYSFTAANAKNSYIVTDKEKTEISTLSDIENENRELREHLFKLGEAVHEYVTNKSDSSNESQLIAVLSRQLSSVQQKLSENSTIMGNICKDIKYTSNNELLNNIIQSVNNAMYKAKVVLQMIPNDGVIYSSLNDVVRILFSLEADIKKLDGAFKEKVTEGESNKNIISIIEQDNKHLTNRLKESNEQVKLLRERVITLTSTIEENNTTKFLTSSPIYQKLESEKVKLEKKVADLETKSDDLRKSLNIAEKRLHDISHKQSVDALWPRNESIRGGSNEDLVEMLKKIDPESKTLQSIAENLIQKTHNTQTNSFNLKEKLENLHSEDGDISHLVHNDKIGDIQRDTIRMQLEQFKRLHYLNENIGKNI
ncbi:hypothetical protein cand_030050 [Cryptosporidium andersoni]|uniref:Uncharacterized protein n=1 Tax=Cryptosporidium andersoni TaxID=117008 RepID=A0A1J4MNL0_9CRYT|nr:hypothetical protein cand_030050 [Cryptosporidium andersoni]